MAPLRSSDRQLLHNGSEQSPPPSGWTTGPDPGLSRPAPHLPDITSTGGSPTPSPAEHSSLQRARQQARAEQPLPCSAVPRAAGPEGETSQADEGPLLVFDGGCVFCRHFATWSELRGGIPGLRIADGRSDHGLRESLEQLGFRLADGAVLIHRNRILHGADAIHWLCSRMPPSSDLRQRLSGLLATPQGARRFYPWLLLARRFALAFRGLPVDPGQLNSAAAQSHQQAQR